MSRQCDVELFAIAVGVVGSTGTGHVDHELEIVSEANILQIPIRANILPFSPHTVLYCVQIFLCVEQIIHMKFSTLSTCTV